MLLIPREANIILAGPMGVGKTAVGRVVASGLGRQFRDSDTMIEERTGMSIVRIFSERSEAYFRSLERELVEAIVQEKSLVVAAGGGMTVGDENLSDLLRSGIVVCLWASIATLAERIGRSSHRPLLGGGDLEERLRSIIEKRMHSYDRIPFRIATDELTIEAAAGRVIEIYRDQTSDA